MVRCTECKRKVVFRLRIVKMKGLDGCVADGVLCWGGKDGVEVCVNMILL